MSVLLAFYFDKGEQVKRTDKTLGRVPINIITQHKKVVNTILTTVSFHAVKFKRFVHRPPELEEVQLEPI